MLYRDKSILEVPFPYQNRNKKLYNFLTITKRKGTLLKRSFFNGLALYLGLWENLAVAYGSAGKVSCAVQLV